MQTLVKQLRDPLHETTRKVRRNLLLSSGVGVLIVKVGLVPKKIPAFGIEFTKSNQEALLYAISAVIAYFLISFIVYLSTEYASWNLALRTERIEQSRTYADLGDHEFERHESFADYIDQINEMMSYSRGFLLFRLLVEVLIPIVFGIVSVIILV